MATTDTPEVDVIYDRSLSEDVIFRNSWIPNFNIRKISDQISFVSNLSGNWTLTSRSTAEQLFSTALARSNFEIFEKNYLVLTENNSGTYFSVYKNWTKPHFRHPTHHIIVSTLRCNLSCKYCHAEVVPAKSKRQNVDLTMETAEAIIKFAMRSPATEQSFEFQGGEPLLNFDLLKVVISKLKKGYSEAGKKIWISIQSNGTMLDDKKMDFFYRNDVSIGTSYDGDDFIHNANRQTNSGKSTSEIVLKNIEKYELPFLPTISKLSQSNWQKIVDEQLATRSVIAFQPVYPINNAKENWEEVGLEFDEFQKLYVKVFEYLKSKWDKNYFPLERRIRLALTKLYRKSDTEFADFGNPCGMVHSQIVYHTNGDIYTCDEGRDFERFRLGNVKDDEYDDIVFGKKIRDLKSESIPKDSECISCAYRVFCSVCPVYEFAKTGTPQKKYAGTDKCRETKLIFDLTLNIISESTEDEMHAIRKFHGI